MNCTEVFNYLFESFNKQGIRYAIIHSYQNLPERFDSDIDTVIDVPKIKDAIFLLDKTLKGTGWRVIQYWRHENYAADCVISNDIEFLQVDFCTHYERNGRVVMSVEELLDSRKLHKNFYIPAIKTEFIYVLVKKVLKKNFSEGSKQNLERLWNSMSSNEKRETKKSLERFFSRKQIDILIYGIEKKSYDKINLETAHNELKQKTSDIKTDLHYKMFDFKRKCERIIHPTGLFIVLLGVDGAGKTTISEELKKRYVTAFRRIDHYHSRVRVLKDISQIGKNSSPIDASNPHGKKHKAGRFVSMVKFAYYFLDFLIGNIKITTAKIKSSLVLIERYYYDYTIDKVRYNLNLSDGFIKFFGKFVKKPDVVFILTGDAQELLERKHEITLEEIKEQKKRLERAFEGEKKAIFIDTTTQSVEECVNQMLSACNQIMRERRKWD